MKKPKFKTEHEAVRFILGESRKSETPSAAFERVWPVLRPRLAERLVRELARMRLADKMKLITERWGEDSNGSKDSNE
jgi:hypothetical protein